jgi:urease accessory protein UreF
VPNLAPRSRRASTFEQRLPRSHRSRRCMTLAQLLAIAAALVSVLPDSARAADRDATPATFAGVFAASAAGDTIRLRRATTACSAAP